MCVYVQSVPLSVLYVITSKRIQEGKDRGLVECFCP